MATDRSALRWTSADILADVRRKASLPSTSTDWTDAVILGEATEVLWSFAGWVISQGGEGRLLSTLDRPISAALTGPYVSADELMLPPLAVAQTIDSVSWTDSTGQIQSRLTRLSASEEATYDRPGSTGSPAAYAIIGDRIRLYPRPTTGGIVRMTYQRRHPQLVADTTANVGTISAIAQTTSTTSTVTHTLVGLTVGDTVDVLAASYPYAPLVASAEVTATPSGTQATLSVPVGQLTGFDTAPRLVKSGSAPYVSFPLELKTCVSEKTAANILRTLGDVAGMQTLEQSATSELLRVMQMLSPRAKRDKPRAINPYSHMRSKLGRGWW